VEVKIDKPYPYLLTYRYVTYYLLTNTVNITQVNESDGHGFAIPIDPTYPDKYTVTGKPPTNSTDESHGI
jgi:hypothetical protein